MGAAQVWSELGAEGDPHDRDTVDDPDVDVAEGEVREDVGAGGQCRKTSLAINDLGAGGDELLVGVQQRVQHRPVTGQMAVA